jgi:hypothetical protein
MVPVMRAVNSAVSRLESLSLPYRFPDGAVPVRRRTA